MRLWDASARAEKALAASHEKMVAKLAADSAVGSFVSTLRNEAATYASESGDSHLGNRSSVNEFSARLAEGHELSRPPGRTARSVDPDTHTHGRPAAQMFAGGVFGARRPDVYGNMPVERWPFESWPAADSGGGGDSGRIENPNPPPGYRS
jgi:hypothetical protein